MHLLMKDSLRDVCVWMAVGRDSAVNVYALSSANKKQVKPVFVHTGHKAVAAMAEPTAVSYTHLTLPTNREV